MDAAVRVGVPARLQEGQRGRLGPGKVLLSLLWNSAERKKKVSELSRHSTAAQTSFPSYLFSPLFNFPHLKICFLFSSFPSVLSSSNEARLFRPSKEEFGP